MSEESSLRRWIFHPLTQTTLREENGSLIYTVDARLTNGENDDLVATLDFVGADILSRFLCRELQRPTKTVMNSDFMGGTYPVRKIPTRTKEQTKDLLDNVVGLFLSQKGLEISPHEPSSPSKGSESIGKSNEVTRKGNCKIWADSMPEKTDTKPHSEINMDQHFETSKGELSETKVTLPICKYVRRKMPLTVRVVGVLSSSSSKMTVSGALIDGYLFSSYDDLGGDSPWSLATSIR